MNQKDKFIKNQKQILSIFLLDFRVKSERAFTEEKLLNFFVQTLIINHVDQQAYQNFCCNQNLWEVTTYVHVTMADYFVLIMDPTEIKQKGTLAETFQRLQF
jgi:hypothetical protein